MLRTAAQRLTLATTIVAVLVIGGLSPAGASGSSSSSTTLTPAPTITSLDVGPRFLARRYIHLVPGVPAPEPQRAVTVTATTSVRGAQVQYQTKWSTGDNDNRFRWTSATDWSTTLTYHASLFGGATECFRFRARLGSTVGPWSPTRCASMA